ncbi:MAG: class I SAM-dependent methyltransferase [Candidatus Woesearchaeota archaeon]|nr:MAG: class I SAM-dependent methyltransferase [Candidatus Woesearchaeota archaeon]
MNQTTEDIVNPILACPDCKAPLISKIGNMYECEAGKERGRYNSTFGIPNLLPYGKSRKSINLSQIGSERINYKLSKNEPFEITINKETVNNLLEDIVGKNIRCADGHILDLLKNLYYKNGKLQEESVYLMTGAFSELFDKYYNSLPEESRTDLFQIVSLARYEAEMQHMKDYAGNFILPKSIIHHIPDDSVVLEVGMGNGATLRRVDNLKKCKSAIGLDFCYGMVEAAVKNTTPRNNCFYAMGDVHAIPLIDNSADAVIMCNTLDRLQNPKLALDEIHRVAKDGSIIILANCMPLQYDIKVNGMKIGFAPENSRFNSVNDAIDYIPNVEILEEKNAIEWHPETVTQGVEKLFVDVFVGKLNK